VAVFIRGLFLDGLPPERVYDHLTGTGANIVYPCILISSAGMVEDRERLAFGRWLWTFPVLVQVLFRGHPSDPDKKAPYYGWRDTITKALEEATTLPGVTDFHDVEVEPGGNVTGLSRARTEPGQTSDPLGPAGFKVAGSLVARVKILRGE
jgi:hypothetical protein